MGYITQSQADEIASPELCINRQVEESQISDVLAKLWPDPNGHGSLLLGDSRVGVGRQA